MMTEDTLRDVLANALQAANADQDEFRARFSSAGDPCVRALVMDAVHGPRPIRETKHALANVCGIAVGELLEAGCKRLGWSVQEPVVLSGEGVDVGGTLDVRAPGFVLDWKLVGESSWKRVQTKPQDKHVLQVNGYAHGKGEPRWIVAYLRATSIFAPAGRELEWRIYSGATDPALARILLRTWATVQEHVKAETLPERDPVFSKDRFPCGWCDHAARCWG